jgi:hypothetical protein
MGAIELAKRHVGISVLAAMVGVCAGEAQIASYVDERGRRVYVNADAVEPTEPERALRSVSAARGSTSSATRARRFEPLIVETARRHGLDPALVKAVIQVESNFNPFAVSHKGAMGLMQLIPATARRFGVENPFDPAANVDGGVRYLKYLLRLFDNDLILSLAAYNAGENAVARYRGIPPFAETRQYVRKISSLYGNDTPVLVAETTGAEAEPSRFGIVKWVDENGKIRFSNTEGF